jgi:hypothetical protein
MDNNSQMCFFLELYVSQKEVVKKAKAALALLDGATRNGTE